MNAQQEAMEMYKGIWYRLALNNRPVFSLKGCLESHGENTLYSISDALEIEVNLYEQDKEKRVELLAAAIQQDMKQQFTYLTKTQAYFLLENIEKSCIKTVSEDFGLGSFFSLIERGWIYWFQIGDETRFVVPEELKKIIRGTFFEEELVLQQQKYYEVAEYIKAFVHLYGVFEIEHLSTVWNQHHPENSFAQRQLEEYIEEAAKYQLVFENEENLVYLAGGIDPALAKGMMQKLSRIPYYVPHPEEISALANRQASAHFQPLDDLVAKWLNRGHTPDEL